MYLPEWDVWLRDAGVYVDQDTVRYVVHLRDVYGNPMEFHQVDMLWT